MSLDPSSLRYDVDVTVVPNRSPVVFNFIPAVPGPVSTHERANDRGRRPYCTRAQIENIIILGVLRSEERFFPSSSERFFPSR